jgi:hypothetical protein
VDHVGLAEPARRRLLAPAPALRLPPAALPLLRGRALRPLRHPRGGEVRPVPGRRPPRARPRPRRATRVRREGRPRRCGDGRVLPRARVVRVALLGRDALHGAPVVGRRAPARRGRGGRGEGRSRVRPAVGPRGPHARDRPLLPSARGAVAGVAPRRRPAARGAAPGHGGARGPPVDASELDRLRGLRPGVHLRRPQPLAGEHAPQPPGGLRGVLGGSRPDRQVRARAAAGGRDDPGATAPVDLREAARRAAGLLGGARPAGRPPGARGLRRRRPPRGAPRRRRRPPAVPRGARLVRGRGRRAPARPDDRPPPRLPPLLRAPPRRRARLPALPSPRHARRLRRGGPRLGVPAVVPLARGVSGAGSRAAAVRRGDRARAGSLRRPQPRGLGVESGAEPAPGETPREDAP